MNNIKQIPKYKKNLSYWKTQVAEREISLLCSKDEASLAGHTLTTTGIAIAKDSESNNGILLLHYPRKRQ